MMSRLVLVGMVAALGITVPTWPEIQEGIGSLHSFTASCLAAMDSSNCRSYEPVVATPRPDRRHVEDARIAPDDRASSIADELNRMADGRNLPAEAIDVRPRSKSDSRSGAGDRRLPDDRRGVPANESMELKLMAALGEAAERGHGEIEPEPAQVVPCCSNSFVPPIVCVFTPSTAITSGRGRTQSSADSGQAHHDSLAKSEPIEPSADGYFKTAESHEGLAPDVETQYSDLADPRPLFEVEQVAPRMTQPMCLSDGLDRASDGLYLVASSPDEAASRSVAPTSGATAVTSSPVAPPRSSPSGSSPEVAQAIRLTREAARAWMAIMKSPDLIRISAR